MNAAATMLGYGQSPMREHLGSRIRRELAVVIVLNPPEDEPREPEVRNVYMSRHSRVGEQEQAGRLINGIMKDRPASDGASWLKKLLEHGFTAVLDVAAELAKIHDVKGLSVNVLSTVGDAVALRLRRALLLEALNFCHWNLAATAELLGMGRRSAGVLRALKDLGLGEEYERLRRNGTIKRGGDRTKSS